jgi:hypothetical protein
MNKKKHTGVKKFYPTTHFKVVWTGPHYRITTKIGGFTQGLPRELTSAQLAQLDMSDGRFRIVE